jgi:hypothetical protein
VTEQFEEEVKHDPLYVLGKILIVLHRLKPVERGIALKRAQVLLETIGAGE